MNILPCKHNPTGCAASIAWISWSKHSNPAASPDGKASSNKEELFKISGPGQLNGCIYLHENTYVFNFDHNLGCSISHWKVSQKRVASKILQNFKRKNYGEVLVTHLKDINLQLYERLPYRDFFFLEKGWTFSESKTSATISEVKGDWLMQIYSEHVK